MGGDKNVPRITVWGKSSKLRSALFRGLRHCGASNLDILQDPFQPLACCFRTGRHFLNVGEGVRIVRFLTKLLKKWIDFRKNKEHLSTASGLQKEFFIEGAMQHERCSHIPITPHLTNPGVFLAGKRTRN